MILILSTSFMLPLTLESTKPRFTGVFLDRPLKVYVQKPNDHLCSFYISISYQSGSNSLFFTVYACYSKCSNHGEIQISICWWLWLNHGLHSLRTGIWFWLLGAQLAGHRNISHKWSCHSLRSKASLRTCWINQNRFCR